MESVNTISEVETCVQSGLEALRNAPLNEQIRFSLKYLVPEGYRPVVQFEEEGRKKRSTASPETWNPATGEIVIYFEPIAAHASAPFSDYLPRVPHGNDIAIPKSQKLPPQQQPLYEQAGLTEEHTGLISKQELTECCQALKDAESAGRNFIALKWFRDDFLPTLDLAWTKGSAMRNAILTAAIESGGILTKKIANPKAPAFPTTTIRLNPDAEISGLTPRFRPVPVRGESGSTTLLRDRGRS